jgi:hypothetical protein
MTTEIFKIKAELRNLIDVYATLGDEKNLGANAVVHSGCFIQSLYRRFFWLQMLQVGVILKRI